MASEFGTVLRRLRDRAGMTQEELERRSGASVSTIRGLETGKRSNPRMTTVQQLADALALQSEDREELLSAAVPGDRGGDQQDDSVTEEPPSEKPGSEQPTSAAYDALADATERLAKAVAARWQREEEQRQIQDPSPLPVRWESAPEKLTDHWPTNHHHAIGPRGNTQCRRPTDSRAAPRPSPSPWR